MATLIEIGTLAKRDAKRALAEDLGFDVEEWPDDLAALDLSGSLLGRREVLRA